jgi:hypothetical protein
MGHVLIGAGDDGMMSGEPVLASTGHGP